MPKVKKPAASTQTATPTGPPDVLFWVRAVQAATGVKLDSVDEQALVAVGVRTCSADRETILRILRK